MTDTKPRPQHTENRRRTGWLALGGLHLLNGTSPLTESDPIILVPLTAPVETAFPSNTIIIRWAELGTVELRAYAAAGGRCRVTTTPAAGLFPGMLAGTALRELAASVAGRGTPGPLVPLFYISTSGTEAHIYGQIRFLADDACFIRISAEPLVIDDMATLGWLPDAVRLHAEQFLFLNNHQRYYRKCFAGRELEYKYTLDPRVDIWTLTVELYQLLLAGELPGYVMEYRDEFQAWDYLNHLYEITAPDAERGYVSFIPTTDGKYLVKRKWYVEDSFDRRERHTYGVEIDGGGFESYISQQLHVEALRLPPFRRARYDVNFESVRTGHVYGIFFDHCSVVSASDIVLCQCELEYLRSRTALVPDEAAVPEEMTEIAGRLESFLRERGLADARGFYSKRTFLKDAVAARPALARVAS